MFDIGFQSSSSSASWRSSSSGRKSCPGGKDRRTPFGPPQRYVSDVKADINREIQLDELKKIQAEVSESARNIEDTVKRNSMPPGSPWKPGPGSGRRA